MIPEEESTVSGTVENGQASATEGMQEETEQASAAGTEAGNGSDDQGTGDSATGAENATQMRVRICPQIFLRVQERCIGIRYFSEYGRS
mgnify:CR=1 FL=1